MTATTQTIRDRDVMVVECDIPADLTLAEYRARRRPSPNRRRGGAVRSLVAGTFRARRASR